MTITPWGWWSEIESRSANAKYPQEIKLKRIVVDPGKRLSLQTHAFRTEIWIIFAGEAEITTGLSTNIYYPGQTLLILPGDAHRVKNVGTTALIIYECQYGEKCSEVDIVRFEDDYGRCEKG